MCSNLYRKKRRRTSDNDDADADAEDDDDGLYGTTNVDGVGNDNDDGDIDDDGGDEGQEADDSEQSSVNRVATNVSTAFAANVTHGASSSSAFDADAYLVLIDTLISFWLSLLLIRGYVGVLEF